MPNIGRNAVLLAGLLLVGSCGASRDEADGADTSESTEAASPGESDGAEGSGGGVATTVQRDPEAIAATIKLEDGETVEIVTSEVIKQYESLENNKEFAESIFPENPQVGAAAGIPPGFDSQILNQLVVNEVFDSVIEARGLEVTDSDKSESEDNVLEEVQSSLEGAEDAEAEAKSLLAEIDFLALLSELGAKQRVLEDDLSVDVDPADKFPCASHILLETEEEATEVLADLEGGADFAELAEERSTGPSGPNGGELGCADPANYVPEFAEALDGAEVDKNIGPVETEFGFHVMVVTDFQADVGSLLEELLTETLASAEIEIEASFGVWDDEAKAIIPDPGESAVPDPKESPVPDSEESPVPDPEE